MASSSKQRELKAVGTAICFLAPNILGFIAFTLVPIVISLWMAFTNWDLTLHNSFSNEPIKFIGIGNFVKLFNSPYFYQYLGNTLYLMLGIPFGIAGSLCVALLLNRKLHGRNHEHYRRLLIGALSISLALLLLSLGLTQSAFATLIVGLAGLMLVGGTAGGSTVYRTLYYLPNFTQGVAIFILWKKLYNPTTGPINRMLAPMLDSFAGFVRSLPEGVASNLVVVPLIVAMVPGLLWLRGSGKKWREGEIGRGALMVSGFAMAASTLFVGQRAGLHGWVLTTLWISFPALALGSVLVTLAKPYERPSTFSGTGGHLLFTFFMVTLISGCVILASALTDLPARVAAGLEPPGWVTDYAWAKPSLILMGLWASIGGNNMILYLAGLSNISPEYYEAADIDGASNWQKFKYITWPQLAPVTFFIVVMSVIYGLQGGFEMARTMTGGGPAGATTTLSYYIYQEGFETGRLGYASSVAWVLFAMVFGLSMVNWKFGNRYVSE